MALQCNHNKPNLKLEYRAEGKALVITLQPCAVCGQQFDLAYGDKSLPAVTLGVRPRSSDTSPQPKKAPPGSLGDGPGKELSQELLGLGLPSCQACKDLAHRMNEWGAETCREKIDEIVADVLPRARVWFDNATLREKLAVWWADSSPLRMAMLFGGSAKKGNLDQALSKVIRQKTLDAIARWEARQTSR